MTMDVVERLRLEPALAWRLSVDILGRAPDSEQSRSAAETTRGSPLVQNMLYRRDAEGKLPFHPYTKWIGAHWILYLLADLGYPPGDESLRPLVEQSLSWLLGDAHKKDIQYIEGRTRRCASQEGNTVWYSLRLGLADERVQELVERLMTWQWPDGGWNCDRHPQAIHSSYHESLLPLRALALYARLSGDARASAAAERTAEIFLKRELFKRLHDGRVINEHFTRLHYPPFWHYDFLSGLKILHEAGFIGDPRCNAALDLLESKRLKDGGFPAEESYSRTTRPGLSGYSTVHWGGVSRLHMNPFVTADALFVLRVAGR